MTRFDACYKTIGRTRIMATVHAAPGRPRGTVVFIHGGALIWGSRDGIQPWLCRLFNERGWTVASIDYRLAPATHLADITDDVRDALAWAASDLGAPLAVFGRSAGGYLALLSGTFPLRPAAIVSFYGYGSVLEDWYTSPSPFYAAQPAVSEEEALAGLEGGGICTSATDRRWPYYLRSRQQGSWPSLVGGSDLGALHRFCPVEHVTAGYPPTYLVHGQLDTDVPFESSARMAGALRAAGVPHELKLVEDKGHAFDQDLDDPVTARLYGRVLAFLSRYLA